MPSTMLRNVRVVLGTGGTIAGTARDAMDNVGYASAQRSAADLLAGLAGGAGSGGSGELSAMLAGVEVEQVAQLDSKDMDEATWLRLAQRVAHHLARPEVVGIVISHGTDTLEETAWLLQRVLAPAKPVVLVAAMRPATALSADGPQNLLDALVVACAPGLRGVLAVLAGRVHGAGELRKNHPYRLDAFSSGDAGPLGVVEAGQLRRFRDGPVSAPLGLALLEGAALPWPWVEIVTSHAGARADAVRALIGAGVQGLVLAATGNGSAHQALLPALDEAEAAGLPVWRCTRCASGVVVGPNAGPAAAMSPWQARIELQLRLLGALRDPA
jgi:L-asparaginase